MGKACLKGISGLPMNPTEGKLGPNGVSAENPLGGGFTRRPNELKLKPIKNRKLTNNPKELFHGTQCIKQHRITGGTEPIVDHK
jgi:hypothetical protein